MRYIAILNDNGDVVEDGTCPNNCDNVTALGREIKIDERWIEGKGETEEDAKEDAFSSGLLALGFREGY